MLQTIVTGDDVTHFKPHPEGLYKALETLKANPEDAIMVGDSNADVLAGKNAKTKTVGVTYAFSSTNVIKQADPDYIYDIRDLLSVISGKDISLSSPGH